MNIIRTDNGYRIIDEFTGSIMLINPILYHYCPVKVD